MRRLPRAAAAAASLLALAALPAAAAPFTPAGDAEVVEKLPAAADPALRSVESLRRQLAARPADNELRLAIARRYFDLAMAQGDPRYVGYAWAALAPLEQAAPADARFWLVRGLLQQYGHDFEAALTSLARASELDPQAVEPVSWRAAVYMVRARHAEAAQECRRLQAIADALLAQGCSAYAQASSGGLQPAYESLSASLARARDVAPGLALWLHTRLAEMALRLERWPQAEDHFRRALQLGVTDQFLLAAYADFLLLRGRPAEAVRLLESWERSDILLLRLALAGRAANDARAAGWSRQLRERFEAAARRGDRLHEQEAARFALDIEGKPDQALALARRNYEDQKEPRDAQMLMEAALAARQPQAAQPVLQWLQASGFEDPRLARLAQRLVAAGATTR